MQRYLMLFILLLTTGVGVFAQPCFQTFFQNGKTAYEQLKFEKAIKQFKAARGCKDGPSSNNLDEWIEKAQNGYIDLIKKERNRARSLALTARSILELQKNDDAAPALRFAQYALEMDDNNESRSAFYESVYHMESDKERRLFCTNTVPLALSNVNGATAFDLTEDEAYLTVFSSYEDSLILYNMQGELIGKTMTSARLYDKRFYNPIKKEFAIVQNVEVLLHPIEKGKLAAEARKVISFGEEPVHDLCFSSDGRWLLIGGADGSLSLHTSDGEFMATISKQEARVRYINFSPDNTFIIVCWENGMVKTYDIDAAGKVTETLSLADKNREPSTVCWASDNNHFMVTTYGSISTYVYHWTGKEVLHYKRRSLGSRAAAFSPDGRMVILGNEVYRLSKSGEATLRFGLAQKIEGAVFISDYGTIGTFLENRIQLWESDDQIARMGGDREDIGFLLYNKKEQQYISLSYGNQIKFWSRNFIGVENTLEMEMVQDWVRGDSVEILMAKGSELYFYNQKMERTRYLKLPVKGILAHSPYDPYLLTIDEDNRGAIWYMDMAKDSLRQVMSRGLGNEFSIAEFSSDGKIAIFLKNGNSLSFVIWDLDQPDLRYLSGYIYELQFAAWSPDGRYLAAGNPAGEILLWDMKAQSNEPIRRISAFPNKSVKSLAISPDGQQIVAGSWDATIKIFDLEGQVKAIMKEHSAAINTLNYAPNGRYIVSGSADQTLKIWDSKGQLISSHDSMYDIKEAHFSADGRYLLISETFNRKRLIQFDPTLILQNDWVKELPDISDKDKRKYGLLED